MVGGAESPRAATTAAFGISVPILDYSLLDGTVWQCDTATPWDAIQLSSSGPVGVRTNVFDGVSYWIDARNDALVAGNQARPLSWFDGKLWDAQPIHGFAIDGDGTGWLASPDSDDGPFAFLVQIDLQTGAVVPVGQMNGLVNGAEVVPEPSALAIALGLIITWLWAQKRILRHKRL